MVNVTTVWDSKESPKRLFIITWMVHLEYKMMVEDIKFSYCFLTNFLSSCQPWPVTGGQNLAPDPPQRDLLLTGLVRLPSFTFIKRSFWSCKNYSNAAVYIGMRMAQFVSGMHQESVSIPCTSWAQLEYSTQMLTPMITWTKGLKENGLHLERYVFLI